MKISYYINGFVKCIALAVALATPGCTKFVEVDPPATSTNVGNVYNSDGTATAVLTGIYGTMAQDENANVGIGGLTIGPSLSADELTLFNNSVSSDIAGFYKNAISASNLTSQFSDFWSRFYAVIFRANSAIEGLSSSQKLSPNVKTRLMGEAYFIRAYMYFNMVNLYGDVPLILTTDYKVNATLSRTGSAQVYEQIKRDLVNAQSMLTEEYLDGTVIRPSAQRVRPNKYAATALLSRVYLYNGEWQNAEAQSSAIISDASDFKLEPLEHVFVQESKETIWSLQPVGGQNNANSGAGRLFVLPASGPSPQYYVYLNDDLVNSFDPGDQRAISWLNSVTVFGIKYNYAYKYKIGAESSPSLEYPVIFRLGEQYLIRAEARAQQNKLLGPNSAQSDIDAIRSRAGLDPSTVTSQQGILDAILLERRHELFTEFGQRWFDLKRTKTIDAVMTPAAIKKGGTWQAEDALYPIPVRELENNRNLIQNKGY